MGSYGCLETESQLSTIFAPVAFFLFKMAASCVFQSFGYISCVFRSINLKFGGAIIENNSKKKMKKNFFLKKFLKKKFFFEKKIFEKKNFSLDNNKIGACAKFQHCRCRGSRVIAKTKCKKMLITTVSI